MPARAMPSTAIFSAMKNRLPARRCPAWRRAAPLLAASCGLLAGCVSLPEASEIDGAVAAYPEGTLPAQYDGRARFRQIYCDLAAPRLAATTPPTHCNDVLWRLGDEPRPAKAGEAHPPRMAPGLHVLVIGGAFSDCRDPPAIAFQDAIPRLTAQGVRIRSVQVSGRSGPQFNARLIAAALGAGQVRPDERVVLVGYSKGAVDALQFLFDFPELRSQVVAVISVAGAIRGSPLADDGEWWYRTFLDEAFEGTCDPGDGQVVQSLRPEVREAWLDSHPLPPGIRYYSLVAVPTAGQLSRALAVSWRRLAEYDRRNDGQVLARDAIVPGSTVLGYVNADHWDIALDLQIPHLSVRPSTRVMPRSELLEAALLFASEDLARAQPTGASR